MHNLKLTGLLSVRQISKQNRSFEYLHYMSLIVLLNIKVFFTKLT